MPGACIEPCFCFQHPVFAPRSSEVVVGFLVFLSFVVKNPPANEGNVNDTVSIPGSGRSPAGGHGNPLHYTRLENPMDRGSWRATVHRVSESDTAKVTPSTAACPSLVCPSCICMVIFNPMWFLCTLLLEELLAQVQGLQRVPCPSLSR